MTRKQQINHGAIQKVRDLHLLFTKMNYGMGDKNIFCMYGSFIISYYIRGVENRILYIIAYLDPHVYVNNPY